MLSGSDLADVRVLHVDDDEVSRYTVQLILKRAGIEVLQAATGAQALALLDRQPHIVLLDINLPDIDGVEVCRRIKADPATAAIKVIHLSAHHVDGMARAYGLDEGADGYLTHPVEPAELLATVRAYMRMQRTEQAYRQSERERLRLVQELQEAVTVRDQFLMIASHELKTPLTSLQLQVERLLYRHQPGSGADPAMAAQLSVIKRQVQRLTALIHDLLDVAQITAGRLSFDLEPVSLNEVVADVTARYADGLARVGSSLDVDLAGAAQGHWDRPRLDQIVTNLLDNALKYGQGKPIELRVWSTGDTAHLLVRDGGIGIAPEDQQRIFGRFERIVSARHYGGFGLGLWIVRQLLEALGGTIAVTSHPGQGSTFVISLPCQPSQAAGGSASPPWELTGA